MKLQTYSYKRLLPHFHRKCADVLRPSALHAVKHKETCTRGAGFYRWQRTFSAAFGYEQMNLSSALAGTKSQVSGYSGDVISG